MVKRDGDCGQSPLPEPVFYVLFARWLTYGPGGRQLDCFKAVEFNAVPAAPTKGVAGSKNLESEDPALAPGFQNYVQPRSRKKSNKIGIGIPSNQSKIYPVAPASLIFSFKFILRSFPLSVDKFRRSRLRPEHSI
jgi:hypothetical protein